MRILKYAHERQIAERDASKAARVKVHVPNNLTARPQREGGKRHFTAPSTGFYTSDQPLSVSGQKWDKKRKVRDEAGQFKSRFSCSDTSEFGDMGTIRHYQDK
jgi:hypothetical protein